MRIVQVSTNDITGGAARAAYRLHHALVRDGNNSTLVVGNKASNDPTVKLVPRNQSVLGIAQRQWDRWKTKRTIDTHASTIARGYELFSSDRAPNGSTLPNHLPDCDVIHLHWVTWFMDYETFFSRLPPNRPVVWTLHDMNPFTGGCHYDAGCGRYFQSCGKCPALGSTDPADLSHEILQRKSKAFERLANQQLHLVLPSQWMADAVKTSPLLGRFARSVIPNGIDTTIFRPIDRTACRQVLNIPVDAKVILFVADSIENTRKGFGLLLEALPLLTDVPGIFLLSIGRPSDQHIAGIPHLALGSVSNDHLLPSVYSAADVMVIPSLQDNLPNTVVEAMACGTPSVGFDVGGIPDMIRPGVTGYLAMPRNVAELAAIIRRALAETKTNGMSKACRDIAVTEYSDTLQAARCVELYRGLIAPPKVT